MGQKAQCRMDIYFHQLHGNDFIENWNRQLKHSFVSDTVLRTIKERESFNSKLSEFVFHPNMRGIERGTAIRKVSGNKGIGNDGVALIFVFCKSQGFFWVGGVSDLVV